MSGSPAARNAAPAAREEVVLTRVFDAPREKVFEAWCSREHLARWWGPRGFTVPSAEVDPRPGGVFRLVMRGPDGSEYPMDGRFVEFVRPERIAFTATIDHGRRVEVDTVVTFDAAPGGTRLTVRQTVPSDPTMARGQRQGWTESLERLAETLAAPDRGNASAREIVTTRVFDAPRDLVWKVWTEPEHVKQWWGPNGFTVTTHEMDVRKGGVWSFLMHGPDGTDYRNRIDYTEVVRPERLEWDHGPSPKFHVTVTFADEGGRTRITMRMLFPTAEERDRTVEKFRALEGQKQTMDRLDTHLVSLSDVPEFVTSRAFDAPRELVWRAWTDLERLKDWWGPKGFTWARGSLDPRPGGTFHYGLTAPDGRSTMWGKFTFREVVPPRRLVFVVSFSDENGGVTRHPMAAEWPLEMLNVVELEEAGGGTRLTLRSRPLSASGPEKSVFAAGRPSMEGGWGGTMDQLAAHLARARG